MLRQNLKEYDFLRKEVDALRNCITTYMGFVIGGSGAAFLGISIMEKTVNSSFNPAFILFVLSLMVTLVLYILYYKFNSHNRHIGYCKLLNQENITFSTIQKVDQFLSWEICMDVLREHQKDEVSRKKMINSLPNGGIIPNAKNRIFLSYEKENIFYRIGSGFVMLLKAVFAQAGGRSWNFPSYVVAVFFMIEILFTSSGIYHLYTRGGITIYNPLTLSMAVILFIQMVYWWYFLKRLYDLNKGTRTIEAYCWQFLPIRYNYIIKCYPGANYDVMEL